MSLARKITSSITLLLVLAGGILGLFSYQTAHRQVLTSAGIELVGCANITTGLVTPAAVAQLLTGDLSKLSDMEEKLNWTVEHKPLFKEVFLLSLDGTIIAADQNLKARGYKAGDSFYFDADAKQALLEHKHAMYSTLYTYDDTKLMTGYGPIYKDHDPTKEIIAIMAINMDSSIIEGRTLETISAPLTAGALVFVLTIGVVYVLIYRLLRPVRRLSAQVKIIASGDLTIEPMLLKSKDEVSQLARDFAQMTSSLRLLISEVNTTSAQVAQAAHELSASAEETGKAGKLTAQATEELSDGSERQLQSLEESSLVIHRMSDHLSRISANALAVSSVAAQSSEQAAAGEQVFVQSNKQMAVVYENMSSLSEIIHELEGHSQEIQEILSIITGIADETNLLALNASIEAARAGEQGAGFAVVASSIRKLSERSAHSVEQITELIAFIVKQMRIASGTVQATAEEMKQGVALVETTGTAFHTIDESARKTAYAIEEVTSSVTDLSTQAQQLVKAVEDLVVVANTTVDHTQSMSAATEQQLAAMQEVDASAAVLSSLSEKLHLLVERFKIS